MRDFLWIFRHYMKKNILGFSNLLLIGLPLVFALAFYLLENYILDFVGVASPLYGIIIPLVLTFQFFGGDLTADWLHTDMKGPTHARLLASPVSPRVFYAGVMLAGWLFNVFYGSVVVAVTAVAFGVEWGHYGLVLIILLCLSFITQLVGLLIFYFTKDQKSGARISYVFGEVMIGITFLPFLLATQIASVDSLATLVNHLPVGAGMNIIARDNMLYSLAVLLAMVAVMSVVTFVVGRQRNDNL